MSNVRNEKGDVIRLECDMVKGCQAQVTHIDEKGFVYCQPHGVERRVHSGRRCRAMKPSEIKKLLSGAQLESY